MNDPVLLRRSVTDGTSGPATHERLVAHGLGTRH